MHGLGSNHILIGDGFKCILNPTKQLQNQARWIFVHNTKKFLIQAAELVQKEAQ